VGTAGNKVLFSARTHTSKEVKEHLLGLGLSSKHNLTYIDLVLKVWRPCVCVEPVHVTADVLEGV